MTDKEMEIQELRRRLEFLKKENEKLTQVHQLDMADIAYQRRQIDFLMEGKHERLRILRLCEPNSGKDLAHCRRNGAKNIYQYAWERLYPDFR